MPSSPLVIPARHPAPASLLLAAMLAACSHGSTTAPVARPVVAERLAPVSSIPSDEYSGDVHARYETTLGFRVPGKITGRYVNLGDSVKAGQLLARLDASDASLNRGAAEAALTGAKSTFDTAARDLARYAELLKKGAVSRSAYEHQQDLFASTQAAYEQAQRQYALRDNQLKYTELHADHDGVVTSVVAEVGQVVGDGQPVMTLAWSGGREVYIDVPEDRIGAFNGRKDIRVSLWGDADKTYAADVREKSASADPATRTFLVKVALRNPGPEVKLGMTAGVTVAEADDPEELVVPLTALTHKDTAAAVWVVDTTSHTKLIPVSVTRYTEDGAVIGGGLAPGQVVVLKGVNELHEGELVQTGAEHGE